MGARGVRQSIRTSNHRNSEYITEIKAIYQNIFTRYTTIYTLPLTAESTPQKHHNFIINKKITALTVYIFHFYFSMQLYYFWCNACIKCAFTVFQQYMEACCPAGTLMHYPDPEKHYRVANHHRTQNLIDSNHSPQGQPCLF
jgi:hypothetical protein